MRQGFLVAAVTAITIGWAPNALTQDEFVMLAGFNITVTRTPKGASLTCEQGCAWKTLAFTLGSKAMAVNDNGMTDDKTGNPEKSGRFLIRFGIDDKGFLLSCDRGCAWRTLGWSFPANGKAVRINEYGMVNKK